MSADEGLVDWVRECLEPVGVVTMRRMMGGATLYCDGTIFALVDEDRLFFKVDAENDAVFADAGLEKFSISMKNGKTGTMNYRRAPLDVHDDPEAMRKWARLGIDAGLRAPPKKRRKKPAGKKG